MGLTIFSPSPIHLEVREEAEMEKKVALMLEAMALPISVFPVPGGPNSSSPLGGARAPCAHMWDAGGQQGGREEAREDWCAGLMAEVTAAPLPHPHVSHFLLERDRCKGALWTRTGAL